MIDSLSRSQPSRQNDGFADARRAMVNSQLRTSDVNTPAIIQVMDSVPREEYVPESKRSFAYIDRAVQIATDRVLNPPVTHGLMLERAAARADDNVLIIGANTGYLAALLAPYTASVTALEEDDDLFSTLNNIMKDSAKVTAVKGNLADGHKGNAPYSLILIDGAVDHIPAAITKQLSENGRIICGVSDNGVMRLAEGRVSSDGTVNLNSYADADIAQLTAFTKAAEYRFA